MKSFPLATVASFAALGLAAACSNGSGGFADTGDAGTDASDAAVIRTPYFGTLNAIKVIIDSTSVYSVDADFAATLDAGIGDGGAAVPCTLGTLSGNCCYLPPGLAVGDAGVPTIALSSAGSILFKDGSTPIANLTQRPGGAYGYTSTMDATLKWQPGDTIAVSASGAVVQAFNASFTTVDDLGALTPTISFSSPTTVTLASPFVVQWTAGTADSVLLAMGALNSNNKPDGSITCLAKDSAGMISVPGALLAKLTSGDVGGISLSRTTTKVGTGPNVTVGLVSTSTTSGALKFQ